MGNNIGAVIVAGGMSSRMKDFKPLLNIGNSTMIETTINNFISIGIENIVIVTGHRSEDIEEKLDNYNVKIVKNKNYKTTHMFDSICIGLREIKDSVTMTFTTPSDSPFVQRFTLKKMIEEMESKHCNLLQPSYNGEDGHPLLLNRYAIDMVLNHDGTMGLQGAINKMKTGYKNLPFVDPGIILDADTPYDYFQLIEYYDNKNFPSVELCLKTLDYFNVSNEVKAHSFKVAMVAADICKNLMEKGIKLDYKLVISASLLHDIAKGYTNHSEIGVNWLSDMGYNEIANIVKNHVTLDYIPEIITEREVVYLADKMVNGTDIVTIEERFSTKKEIYKDNKEILNIIELRKNIASNLYNTVFNI